MAIRGAARSENCSSGTVDPLHFVVTIFLYSLVVLCLDAYVNLTVMSCKTEQSLINHLVLAYLVLS